MKKTTFILVSIIAATPFFIIFFVKFVTPYLNDSLPRNIRTVDSPLYSYMKLNPNYNGMLIKYNLFTGIEKIAHSTNAYGFRSPEIDFNKPIVLISGDSIPFGMGLNDADTFGWILNGWDRNHHYINASIPGKSISHNLITLEYFIGLAKEKNAKITCFVNYVNWKDFVYDKNRTYDEVMKKWKRKDLSLKQRLSVTLPLMYFVYRGLKNPSEMNTKFILFLKSIFLFPEKIAAEDVKEPPGFELGEDNLNDLKKMQRICYANDIELITIITPSSKDDIFEEHTNSDRLKRKLQQYRAGNTVLAKDILKTDDSLIGKMALHGDYAHFSKFAMHRIAEEIYALTANLK